MRYFVEKARNDKSGASALESFGWSCMALGGIIGAVSGGFLLEIIPAKFVIAANAISPLLLVLCSITLEEQSSAMKTPKESTYLLLYSEIKQPKIFKSLIFILILGSTSPRFPELMRYYMKDVLELSSSLGLITFFSIIIGSGVYHHYLKGVEYNRLILISQIMLVGISGIDLALVTGV